MRKTITAIAATAAMALVPSVASADSGICHNGILSDDAGQGCADGLYEATYGSAAHASGICSDGVLSNDAGRNCPDGLYERTYGSARTYRANTASGTGRVLPGYGGGSSNPMVNPACESGGNSQVVSSNGMYWGKYQFDRSTWVAHGGSPGSYGNANEAMQDQIAARVTYDAWPNC